MFGSRSKKIFGDVLSRKGRTALVALSIAIGVLGVGTLVGMGDLIVKQLNGDIDEDKIAMTHAYVISQGEPISSEENQEFLRILNDASKHPGIVQVEGQAVYLASWIPADASADTDFNDANLLAYTQPFGDVQLEPISRIVEGRYPVSGNNEIAVEKRFATEHGVAVGDKLIFRQLGDSAEAPVEWEIVGLVFHPYFTLSIAVNDDIAATDSIYATYEDAQQIAGFPGLSSFYARYTDVPAAEANLNTFLETISTETPYVPVFSWVDDPESNFIVGQVQQITSILNILAAIAMIVSGFLVVNVINTIVAEQKKQIGVMKSLGATRWDNFMIYTGMAFLYGLIGSILGILLSIPAALVLAKAIGPLAGALIEGFKISTTAVIMSLVLGVLVPVLAAIIPVFNGTRVSVLDAMTDLGISSNWGKTRLSRLIGALPVPMNLRQALSNIAQKKGRLALTILTLTLAVASFMGVTAVFTALGDQIDALFETFNYDILITPQEAQGFDEMSNLIAQNIDGVESVFAGYNVSVGIEGYESDDQLTAGSNQLGAGGIDPRSPVIQFDLKDGSGWQDDPNREGVIVTRPLAEALEKELGETIIITLNGRSHEMEIIGIDQFPFPAIFFDWEFLAAAAGFTDDEGQPVPGSFYMVMEGDATIEEIDAVIDNLTEVMLANNVQAVYTNQPASAESQAEGINIFAFIFNIVSAVMALVGAIGLLATLSMSVFERQKEIGVMRSIGASSTTIVSQFLVEGILIGFIAWLLAAPLSVLLGIGLVSALDFGDAFSFEYPPTVLVMGFIGVTIIAAVASFWPSISAARKTVSDILRYQ